MIRYKVTLTQNERDELMSKTKGGNHAAKKVVRALILLNCDEREYSDKVANEDVPKVLKFLFMKQYGSVFYYASLFIVVFSGGLVPLLKNAKNNPVANGDSTFFTPNSATARVRVPTNPAQALLSIILHRRGHVTNMV